MLTDTIVAISTGNTNSGINIIRISGSFAKKTIKNLFDNYKKIEHQKIIYGKIKDNANSTIDEVLISYFRAPNSYTAEDIIEINCHGGKEITGIILNEILKTGFVRLAEPGEFTKRAFLNGKMDLSQAEAIIDVINAKTKIQTKIAVNQLSGGLNKRIKEIQEPLIEILANIEVGIDYPEYEYEELGLFKIKDLLQKTEKNIEGLVKEYDKNKYIKEGINIVILGSANVGKSSLLNVLLGEDRAIVTDIEGTTRDVLEQKIVINNIECNFFDTAGLRDTEDVIEQIGIKKALKLIDKADLIIYLLDGTKNISERELNQINEIEKRKKNIIICLNKTDISCEKNSEITALNRDFIRMSLKTLDGIEELKKQIEKISNSLELTENTETTVINKRHEHSLKEANKNLKKAIKDIEENKQLDIVSISIKETIHNISNITGENADEEIINKVFERFCLGK